MLAPRGRIFASILCCILFLKAGCTNDVTTPETPPPISFPEYAGTWKVHSIDDVVQADTLLYRFLGSFAILHIDSSRVIFHLSRDRETITVKDVRNEDSIPIHPAMLEASNSIAKHGDTVHVQTSAHRMTLVKLMGSSGPPTDWYVGQWNVIGSSRPELLLTQGTFDEGEMMLIVYDGKPDPWGRVIANNQIVASTTVMGPLILTEGQITDEVNLTMQDFGDTTIYNSFDTTYTDLELARAIYFDNDRAILGPLAVDSPITLFARPQ